MSAAREVVPTWDYVVTSRSDDHCLFCRRRDVPLMLPQGDEGCGLCEACAVQAYHAWKRVPGDVPPGLLDEDACKVSAVRVVVARLRQVGGAPADSGHLASYEVLRGEGESGLPGADVDSEAGPLAAADAALAACRVRTWGTVTRLLCRAHLPRGKLCAVYLADAWACLPGVKVTELEFRAWPPSDHAVPGMRGFCATVEDVLAVELLRRRAAQEASELSVHMRQCAAEYVDLQRQKRSGELVDDSMTEVYRRSMTDDERRVAKLIRVQEEVDAAARSEAVSEASPAADGVEGQRPEGPRPGPEDPPEEEMGDVAPSGGGEVVDAEFTEQPDDDAEPWPTDLAVQQGPVPEGFARRGTPLSKK